MMKVDLYGNCSELSVVHFVVEAILWDLNYLGMRLCCERSRLGFGERAEVIVVGGRETYPPKWSSWPWGSLKYKWARLNEWRELLLA